ncbi:hypothetical protein ACIBO5_60840 [Nonomuraea angiospora]|uniref:hypothetical protein n=1 Tax=Nonomuraea angiospora TaxID=46172 RepID=UPI0037A3E29C
MPVEQRVAEAVQHGHPAGRQHDAALRPAKWLGAGRLNGYGTACQLDEQRHDAPSSVRSGLR